MPPPNVTGILHLGHVLNNTIQDILCRKARMEGKEVLWLPGTDHAAWPRRPRSRSSSARRKRRRATISPARNSSSACGSGRTNSAASSRSSYARSARPATGRASASPLDRDYERAVQEAFVRLYNERLIYRGLRMVNWCPSSLTALSDEEVIPTVQKGSLYYVKYELVPDAADSVAGVYDRVGSLDESRRAPMQEGSASVAPSIFPSIFPGGLSPAENDPALGTEATVDLPPGPGISWSWPRRARKPSWPTLPSP